MVALTFDDGPNEGATAAIRDVLEARGYEAVLLA